VETISIPFDSSLGTYVIKERIEYRGANVSASSEFLVVEGKDLEKSNLIFAGIVIIITIFLLIFILLIAIYKKLGKNISLRA